MLRRAALLKAAVTGVKLRGGTCLVRGGGMLRVAAPGKWKVARAESNQKSPLNDDRAMERMCQCLAALPGTSPLLVVGDMNLPEVRWQAQQDGSALPGGRHNVSGGIFD